VAGSNSVTQFGLVSSFGCVWRFISSADRIWSTSHFTVRAFFAFACIETKHSTTTDVGETRV
jgi:hypothetical protein